MRPIGTRTSRTCRAIYYRPLSRSGNLRRSLWLFVLVLAVGLSGGCDRSPASDGVAEQHNTTGPSATETPSRNRLEMHIDGKPWRADRELHAVIHPPGLEDGMVIGGSFGPKDSHEQVFSLILQGMKGPGPLRIRAGDPNGSVVQIANLSPERYLIGSILGFDLAITIEELSTEPLVVELLFKGQLIDNNGIQVKVTNGRFSYHE